MPDEHPIPAAFAQQVAWCQRLKAPFTAALLAWLADDWRAGGAMRRRVPHWPGDPLADLLPLRIAGALHGLALSERHPDLTAHYPPRAETFNAAAIGPGLVRALEGEDAHWQLYLAGPPQTNEPLRSASLLGGFGLIAQRFPGRPLALLELGASAGLNLLWDAFHYRLGDGRSWGDPASPVRLQAEWRGTPPAVPARIEVAQRRGCDRAPFDLMQRGAALRLASYVWPEQHERMARLQSVIWLAGEAGLQIDEADAADWTEQQLAEPSRGVCTVVFHSIVWHYLAAGTQQRLRAAIESAGARARDDAPLAWLRLEMPQLDSAPELRLSCWPGGDERLLARAHPHGAWTEWC